MRNINKSLTYIFVALMLTGVMSSCTKSAFDELEALTAQKSLLELKFQQEITLEKLRQSGATALEQVKYQFAVNTLKYNDSLTANSNRSRDISVYVQEINTTSPLAGATVSIPTTSGTLISAVTDKNGLAFFAKSKTTFVPYRTAVFVSKEGYASTSLNGLSSISDNATVYLWNQDKKVAGNTLKGKVNIELDLTNTASEAAAKMLVNAYTIVTINGKDQRVDFSTLTDASGNYSIALPDLPSTLYIAHNSIDSTSTMYINNVVPGAEGAPSKTAIATTFYLGQPSYSTSGSLGPEQAYNVLYNVPYQLGRFYAYATTPDLNSKVQYVKFLTFNLGSFDYTTNTKSASLSGWSNYGQVYYNEDGTTTTLAPIKYASTTTSTPAKVVDLIGDYFTTLPVIQYNLTNGGFSTASNVTNGVSAKNDGLTGNTTLYVYNKGYTSSSTSYSTFVSNNRSAFFTSIGNGSINGGKTYQLDLTYGTGKLKIGVR